MSSADAKEAKAAEPAGPGGLCGSGVEAEWLEGLLRKEFEIQDSVKLASCTAEKIGVGMGFLSHILKVKMDWEPEQSGAPTKLVLKVPTSDTMKEHIDDFAKDDEDQKKEFSEMMENDFLPHAHKNECFVYDLIRKEGMKGVPTPRTFYARPISKGERGVIVMEDLSANSHTVNLVDCLRLQQVLNIAAHLAHLHAWSLNNREKWEGKISLVQEQMFKDFDKMMGITSKNLTDTDPELFKGAEERLGKLCSSDKMKHVLESSHEDLGLPTVLVHGDLWTNNILFHKDDSQANLAADETLAFIDWQISHPGSIGEDFARLICMGCSVEMREKELDHIFSHYYDTLKKDLHGTVPFSLDKVRKAYEAILPFAMAMFIFPLPVLLKTPLLDPTTPQSGTREERFHEMLIRGKSLIDECERLSES